MIAEQFKAAFRRYPTGVAVISAIGAGGPIGLTASSVASVSVDPPALSFSAMGTRSARALLEAESFVVNLLGAAGAEVARQFASSGGPRFTEEQGWTFLPTGEPVLRHALASLRATPLHRLPVGDSTVVVASVHEVFLGPAGGRLVYHDRQFIQAEEFSN
ncbi:flavin reductase family protein [Actinoplanes sp. CA-131856]